jgi:hypothetical protein
LFLQFDSARLLNSNRCCCPDRFAVFSPCSCPSRARCITVHNRNIISDGKKEKGERSEAQNLISPFSFDFSYLVRPFSALLRRPLSAFLLSFSLLFVFCLNSIHSVCGKFFISFLKCIIVNAARWSFFPLLFLALRLVVALISITQWRLGRRRTDGRTMR